MSFLCLRFGGRKGRDEGRRERAARTATSRSTSRKEHVLPPTTHSPQPSSLASSSSLPSSSPLAKLASLRILAIAVLGKHGNPLFLQSYSSRRGGGADLKWHYAAHTALDFFDERGTPALELLGVREGS